MGVFDFFKRQQGGAGGAGGSTGDASGVGAKSGEYIPRGSTGRPKLGGPSNASSTIEGSTPQTINTPLQSSSKPFPGYGPPVGEPTKGSMFSKSTDLVQKTYPLATTPQFTSSPGLKAVSPSNLESMSSRATNFIKGNAGKIAGAAGIGLEGYNTYQDIKGDNIPLDLKASRVAETATRLGSAAVGAELGGVAGTAFPVVGNIAGAALGGLAGYYAPDTLNYLANKVSGRNVELPSQAINRINSSNKQGSTEPVTLGGKLADELNSMQPVKQYTSPYKKSDGSSTSSFDIDPRNYGVSNGINGNYVYTKNQDGSISKVDMSSGKRQSLGGNVSSIGSNGTNSDGSPLSPRDQAAMNRSAQMIQDWKNYKQEKMYNNMINNSASPSGRTVNTNLIKIGQAGLDELAKNKLTKQQIESTSANQRLAQDVEASKANRTNQLTARGQDIDIAKAKSQQQMEAFKLIDNMQEKGMIDPNQQYAFAKRAGVLDRDTTRYIFGNYLKDVKNRKQLGELVDNNTIPLEAATLLEQDYNE